MCSCLNDALIWYVLFVFAPHLCVCCLSRSGMGGMTKRCGPRALRMGDMASACCAIYRRLASKVVVASFGEWLRGPIKRHAQWVMGSAGVQVAAVSLPCVLFAVAQCRFRALMRQPFVRFLRGFSGLRFQVMTRMALLHNLWIYVEAFLLVGFGDRPTDTGSTAATHCMWRDAITYRRLFPCLNVLPVAACWLQPLFL